MIPRAIMGTDNIAFVICVSCPGMASSDQTAYQIMRMAFCNDTSREKIDPFSTLLSELKTDAEYDTYAEYRRYREVLDTIAGLVNVDLGNRAPIPAETWGKNSPELQSSSNPLRIIEETNIPILAIFGDGDRNIDPFQAAYAWGQALARGGNQHSHVVVIPGANHVMMSSETGCIDESQEMFDQYAQTKGYESFEDLLLVIKSDPYRPGIYADYPLARGVMDLISEWLDELQP